METLVSMPRTFLGFNSARSMPGAFPVHSPECTSGARFGTWRHWLQSVSLMMHHAVLESAGLLLPTSATAKPSTLPQLSWYQLLCTRILLPALHC